MGHFGVPKKSCGLGGAGGVPYTPLYPYRSGRIAYFLHYVVIFLCSSSMILVLGCWLFNYSQNICLVNSWQVKRKTLNASIYLAFKGFLLVLLTCFLFLIYTTSQYIVVTRLFCPCLKYARFVPGLLP